jgi:hypothetical protein
VGNAHRNFLIHCRLSLIHVKKDKLYSEQRRIKKQKSCRKTTTLKRNKDIRIYISSILLPERFSFRLAPSAPTVSAGFSRVFSAIGFIQVASSNIVFIHYITSFSVRQ